MPQLYRGGHRRGGDDLTRPTPYEVRTWVFEPRRRGLDPDQVRGLQLRLADELATLHREVRLLAEENDRLKRALRDWQSRHTRPVHSPGRRDNEGRRGNEGRRW